MAVDSQSTVYDNITCVSIEKKTGWTVLAYNLTRKRKMRAIEEPTRIKNRKTYCFDKNDTYMIVILKPSRFEITSNKPNDIVQSVSRILDEYYKKHKKLKQRHLQYLETAIELMVKL